MFDAALTFARVGQDNPAADSITTEHQKHPTKATRNIRADSLLPASGEHAENFKHRARQFAMKQVLHKREINLQQFQRLHVGEEAFGISYGCIDEIMYAGNITAVPCTPNFIGGVLALAGDFLCVIDLGVLFQDKATPMDSDETSVIVVHGSGMRVGLLVSRVDDNESYDAEMISQPMRSEGPLKRTYVKGIYDQTVTFLDIDALLADISGSIGA